MPTKFWGIYIYIYIFGQHPSDSKPNWLHIDIHLPVYPSIDSSKMIRNPPEALMNFNQLFLELNWFIYN